MSEELYLLIRIGGERVALAAAHVGSVVEIEDVTPVPLVAPHVAGLFALRSRVLTVIDSLAALGLGPTDLAHVPLTAVIVNHDGHSYALLVDAVEDVIAAGASEPAAAPLAGGWARTAMGVIQHEGQGALLLDPVALILGPPLAAAA